MATPTEIIRNELSKRILDVREAAAMASALLANDEFLQCAVRLQELAKHGQFTEFELAILDSMSQAEDTQP